MVRPLVPSITILAPVPFELKEPSTNKTHESSLGVCVSSSMKLVITCDLIASQCCHKNLCFEGYYEKEISLHNNNVIMKILSLLEQNVFNNKP
jgi:hypothetical protein